MGFLGILGILEILWDSLGFFGILGQSVRDSFGVIYPSEEGYEIELFRENMYFFCDANILQLYLDLGTMS